MLDPVCHMPITAAAAAASEQRDGQPVYFCSRRCHERYLADPAAYPLDAPAEANCHAPVTRLNGSAALAATAWGLTASGALLAVYLGLLSLLSGARYALDQYLLYWPYLTALALGFGIQVGLFVYLRRAVRAAASAKAVAVTGTTSGAAMLSCCTHYLVNLLPALGATGLVSLVGQYQIELFWLGLAANLAGIVYVSRRLVLFHQGA